MHAMARRIRDKLHHADLAAIFRPHSNQLTVRAQAEFLGFCEESTAIDSDQFAITALLASENRLNLLLSQKSGLEGIVREAH